MNGNLTLFHRDYELSSLLTIKPNDDEMSQEEINLSLLSKKRYTYMRDETGHCTVYRRNPVVEQTIHQEIDQLFSLVNEFKVIVSKSHAHKA